MPHDAKKGKSAAAQMEAILVKFLINGFPFVPRTEEKNVFSSTLIPEQELYQMVSNYFSIKSDCYTRLPLKWEDICQIQK
jgi:hypothetical protein